MTLLSTTRGHDLPAVVHKCQRLFGEAKKRWSANPLINRLASPIGLRQTGARWSESA